MKLIIRIAIIILFVFPNACGGSVTDKDSAVKWFNKNESELNVLIKKLLSHPNIRRVQDMTMDFIPKYGEFSDADLKVYDEILKFSKNLDIKAVVVSRERAVITGDLISIQFILISKGIYVSGYALAVEYIPNADFIEKAKEYDTI